MDGFAQGGGMKVRASYIYFLKPVGMSGPIKIGCSYLPECRLRSLTCWSPFPLEMIVTVPGTRSLENMLHGCFADALTHFEWFHPIPALLAGIAALKAGKPLDEAFDLQTAAGSIRNRAHKRFVKPETTRARSYQTRLH